MVVVLFPGDGGKRGFPVSRREAPERYPGRLWAGGIPCPPCSVAVGQATGCQLGRLSQRPGTRGSAYAMKPSADRLSPGEGSIRRGALLAYVEVFTVCGYKRTEVADLVAAYPTIDDLAFCSYFADKETCFLRAYDLLVAEAIDRIAIPTSAHGPWPARLAAGLHRLLELIDANPAAARLVLVESQFAGEAALRRYMATLKNLAAFMCGGRRCVATTEHPPPILDSVLPAGVASALRLQLLRGEPAASLYAELLALLLQPYLGETETASALAVPLGQRERRG
jgi:hypothetical protein